LVRHARHWTEGDSSQQESYFKTVLLQHREFLKSHRGSVIISIFQDGCLRFLSVLSHIPLLRSIAHNGLAETR